MLLPLYFVRTHLEYKNCGCINKPGMVQKVNADFEGADARGASFERNNMDGVNLKNAILSGAYVGDSLPGVENLENADFTDASIPAKVLGVVCGREDAKGTNPTTGEATRDTLMCP